MPAPAVADSPGHSDTEYFRTTSLCGRIAGQVRQPAALLCEPLLHHKAAAAATEVLPAACAGSRLSEVAMRFWTWLCNHTYIHTGSQQSEHPVATCAGLCHCTASSSLRWLVQAMCPTHNSSAAGALCRILCTHLSRSRFSTVWLLPFIFL